MKDMTPPGGIRQGPWIKAPNDAEIRVVVRRGWNCCKKCEHVPPRPNEGGQNHGQHCDEWYFQYRVPALGRSAARAVQLLCFSWIRNGAIEDELRLRIIKDGGMTIYGATLVVHRATSGGEACELVGHCEAEFLGYLFSADFFEQVHSDALEPLVVKPVDDIDLVLVTDVVPIWEKLAALLKEATSS